MRLANPLTSLRRLLLIGFLTVVLLALPSARAIQSTAASPGLVAAYGFEEGSGGTAADASGNGLTGSLSNTAWAPAGKFGKALSFNGSSSFVDLGNPSQLQLTGSMTWSAWIYATANPGDDGQIIAKSGSSDGWQLKSSPDTGPHTFGVAVSANANSHVQRYSNTVRQLNTWYYVTGVYDAAARNLDIYVNGVLDNGVLLGTVPSSQFNSSQNVSIGRRAGGYAFQGIIDEVRIYNRALTLAEIQLDMNSPVASLGPSDSVAPTVDITAPAAGAQVADIVNVTADAEDDVGVAGVHFYIDNVPVGPEDSSAPYALVWDTRDAANGAHILTARARDAAGNTALSDPVSVNVANQNHFQNETLAVGFSLPTAMKFLPDGRLLVAELAGRVLALDPPYTTIPATPFLHLTNVGSAGVQQGIYDIALDPSFLTNHYYYVFYTLGSPNHDRLSRFTANVTLSGTIVGSEFVLYEDPNVANAEHHGGAIVFGNDGKLYFTTGDHFDASSSQILSSPRGKLHRINLDGSIPTDNPFYDGAGPNWDSIWAIGLRNPFRAYTDISTGRIYIGDVGGNDYSVSEEEINVAIRGADYGWPSFEGSCSNTCTSPLFSYPHNGRDASITAGFVYHGTAFPPTYKGVFFFADYAQNWIRGLILDGGGSVSGVFNFEPQDGSVDGPYGDIVYLLEGPDGAIYYLDLGYSDVSGTFGLSKVRRIGFVESNQAPLVSASASPTSGSSPLNVQFSSAGSTDPEGVPLTYLWELGDSSTSTQPNPSHQYAQSGTYSARLTVSDGASSSISSPISITVGNRPVVVLTTTPTDGSLFVAGQTITYGASASDQEDGSLPDASFVWNIDFLHEGHVHPGAPVVGATSGSFVIPDSGHDFSGNTRFRITVTVTDSDGLTATQTAFVWPQKVDLTFQSVPSGLTVFLDGIAVITPFAHDALVGFHHSVEARGQSGPGHTYEFLNWSDGGGASHSITVPDHATSYLANFADASPPATSGLVAAYGFEEGSGGTAADASGNGLTGSLSNTAWAPAGKFGKALSFNGSSSFVDLGNPSQLQLTGSMTWSAWIYATANPGDDGQIIAKSGSSDGWQLKSSPDTGPHTFGVAVSANANSHVQRYSNTVRQLNTWYYVTGVYDAAARNLDIYVNGVLDNGVLLGTVPSSQFNSSQNVSIGRRAGGYAFQGIIDEVRIYNRALTLAEIQLDMNSPVSSQTADTSPPGDVTGVTATAVSSTRIDVDWNDGADDVGVTGYDLERCQGDGCSNLAHLASPTGSAFSDTVAPNTSYSYRIRALDAAGNLSLHYSNIATAATPSSPDSTPPDTVTGLTASTINSSEIHLTWNPGTDNVGVTSYRLERCQGATCSNFAQIVALATTSFNDGGLNPNTTYRYRAKAVDAASNESLNYSLVADGITQPLPADTTPPTDVTSITVSATSVVQINVNWTAATDNVAVTGYLLERCLGAGCNNFAALAAPPGTSYTDTGLSPGASYSYRVRAADGAGNISLKYSPVGTTITPMRPPGLVAAYGFEEGSGGTAADASGNGLTGSLSNTAWAPAGKFGKALSFNGSSSFVDLGNPSQLQLTGSMTWSAWIYATANPGDDGQIIAKSGSSDGWQLKSSPDTGPHTFGVAVSANANSHVQRYSNTVRQLNTWYYVTGVYDAAARNLDIYVNGVLDNGVLLGTVPSSQFNSSQNVSIGRRAGGYAFQGIIDEVRIYNRALTLAEIQLDMNSPVGP